MTHTIERLLALVGCVLMTGGFIALIAVAKGDHIYPAELGAAVATISGMALCCWLLVRGR